MTDYNDVMGDEADDYAVNGEPEEGNGLGPAIKKIVIVIAAVIALVLVGTLAKSLMGGNEEPTPAQDMQEQATTDNGGSSSSSQGQGLGLSNSDGGNTLALTNAIKDFGAAVYSGDGEKVYNLTSQRCRSSVSDAQAFSSSFVQEVGSDFNLKDLTYDSTDPRLGISFVSYEAKDHPSATLDVYFLWDRGSNSWVMDSCNS